MTNESKRMFKYVLRTAGIAWLVVLGMAILAGGIGWPTWVALATGNDGWQWWWFLTGPIAGTLFFGLMGFIDWMDQR